MTEMNEKNRSYVIDKDKIDVNWTVQRAKINERIAARRKKVQTSTWDRKAELILRELYCKANEHF